MVTGLKTRRCMKKMLHKMLHFSVLITDNIKTYRRKLTFRLQLSNPYVLLVELGLKTTIISKVLKMLTAKFHKNPFT